MSESESVSSNTSCRTIQLRSSTHHWLLGQSIVELTGAKRPTNLQVMRRYLWLRENNPRTTRIRILVKHIYDELMSKFWIRSRIPTKPEKNCLDLIEKMISKYDSL